MSLRKAEKPWRPRSVQDKGEVAGEETQTKELYHKFQGILNKLTPQKFQALAEQVLMLKINTEERLSGCVDMIFSKVSLCQFFVVDVHCCLCYQVAEVPNSSTYAYLCKMMSPIKVEFVSEEGEIEHTNFRRMLHTKCQKEFDKGVQDDETVRVMLENAETVRGT